MFITLRNQALKIFLLLACLVLLALHLSVPINLTAVDIGRHIKNGELVLSGNSRSFIRIFILSPILIILLSTIIGFLALFPMLFFA